MEQTQRKAMRNFLVVDRVPPTEFLQSDIGWAPYQIGKIASCACAGNAGNVFPATDFKRNR